MNFIFKNCKRYPKVSETLYLGISNDIIDMRVLYKFQSLSKVLFKPPFKDIKVIRKKNWSTMEKTYVLYCLFHDIYQLNCINIYLPCLQSCTDIPPFLA